MLWCVRKDNSLRRAIYQEWSAQIERCLELGLRPTHLDSHYDVHVLPELLSVVCRLQRKFGIRVVRRRTRIPTAPRKLRRTVRDGIWAAGCVLSGSKLTDYRCGMHEFWKAVQSGVPLAGNLEKSSIELVVHPGNHYAAVFCEETDLLRAGWLEHIKERALTAKGAAAPRSYSWSGLR